MPTRLVFLDMEMTGLNPETDRILEIAAAIVEVTPERLGAAIKELKTVSLLAGRVGYVQSTGFGEGPPCAFAVLQQPEGVLEAMNAWSIEQHGKSGLTELVRCSPGERGEIESCLIDWLGDCDLGQGEAVLAGNIIHFDRAFIRRWMPDLDAFLHYRLFDISTLRQLVLAQGALPTNRPSSTAFWKAHGYATQKQFGPDTDEHRALPDVIASIEELLVYLEGYGVM